MLSMWRKKNRKREQQFYILTINIVPTYTRIAKHSQNKNNNDGDGALLMTVQRARALRYPVIQSGQTYKQSDALFMRKLR